MLILSRVCAEFRNAAGEPVFAVTPAIRDIFVEAPDAIREDPLFRMLVDDGSMEAGVTMPWYRFTGLDGKVLGMLQLRHCLNETLEKYAGHIGYSVAPSERRKGFAKAMLHDALGICRDIGLKRVLVSCRPENEGSRRTILANGGVYEKTVHEPEENIDLEQYWIEL